MRRATYALVVTSVVYWEGHMYMCMYMYMYMYMHMYMLCEAVSERAVSRSCRV